MWRRRVIEQKAFGDLRLGFHHEIEHALSGEGGGCGGGGAVGASAATESPDRRQPASTAVATATACSQAR